MGRLQKKKTSAQKKKKKKTSTGAGAPAQNRKAADVASSSNNLKVIKKQAVGSPKAAVAVKPAPSKTEPNLIQKSVQFLREVKVELKKVTWPSRKQTIGSTVVVIIIVTIIAFFLGAVDIGLSSLVKIVLQ